MLIAFVSPSSDLLANMNIVMIDSNSPVINTYLMLIRLILAQILGRENLYLLSKDNLGFLIHSEIKYSGCWCAGTNQGCIPTTA